MALLDELIGRITGMPADARAQLEKEVMAATAGRFFIPSPGPQTEAYLSQADEVYYGGEAGGGKSALLVGLALEEHTDSLILRRVNDDAKDIAKVAREFVGEAGSYNGQDRILRVNDREVRFGGCQFEEDKERYKGRAKDFYGFDEIGDFTESQYLFITTWNRSAKPGQRCRIMAAGNPPTRPEGLWVLKRWAAWLDPAHPKPAKPGELRWYVRTDEGEEIEVEGRGPHRMGLEVLHARSRTFIRARLDDNPFLRETDYRASLDSLPPELRRAYRDGVFTADLADDAWQLIPTEWVLAAQARWRPGGHLGQSMTAIAMDPAGGGQDAAEMAARYGGWVSPFVTVKGPETADGNAMAGRVVMMRRNDCPVVIDGGGGYGGATALRLKDNGIEAAAFVGAEASTEVTRDKAQLAFTNCRAQAHWRLREALDPTQEGGSIIALPPDNELKADLCAIRWELTRTGVKVESKEEIRKRIGRSPGKGDVLTMLFDQAEKMVVAAKANRSGSRPTTANMGARYAAVHARRMRA
ncbi:hypothetical protein A3862_27400 [Methylobacterium sp. XJLW]|nr:hypothetical protein A3862_27400 [Methylobacterium sp. XJLW]